MDISLHVPLYKAILVLLRAVASCPVLAPLLVMVPDVTSPSHNSNSTGTEEGRDDRSQSIHFLLHKLDFEVSSYITKLT